MRFTILAIDGESVTDLAFAAIFRQTAPVRISEVSGASYVYRLSIPYVQHDQEVTDGSDAEATGSAAGTTLVMETQTSQTEAAETQTKVPEADEPTPDFREGRPDSHGPPGWGFPLHKLEHARDNVIEALEEIAMLRAQVVELQAIIRSKKAHVHRQLGHHEGPPPPAFKLLKQCGSFRCVVNTLSDKVKHTAGDIFGYGPPHHGPPHHGPPHHPHEHPGHHPKGNHTDDQCPPHCRPGPSHHGPPHHGPPHHGPPPPFWHGDHHDPPPPWHHGPPKHRPHHDDHERPEFDTAEGPAEDEASQEPPHHKHESHGHGHHVVSIHSINLLLIPF